MMATANPEPALRRFVPVAAARGLLAILVVAYATISLTGAVHTLPQSAGHWIAGMLLAMAGALCVARVFMVPGQRVAWLAIGIGCRVSRADRSRWRTSSRSPSIPPQPWA